MRKTPKIFGFMHTSQCTRVWGQKSRVHVSMGLKVAYNNKKVFFRNYIGTSKYNIIPCGIKSLQRDKEGHKMWSTMCVKISHNRLFFCLFSFVIYGSSRYDWHRRFQVSWCSKFLSWYSSASLVGFCVMRNLNQILGEKRLVSVQGVIYGNVTSCRMYFRCLSI